MSGFHEIDYPTAYIHANKKHLSLASLTRVYTAGVLSTQSVILSMLSSWGCV